jgi:hypothetical protein
VHVRVGLLHAGIVDALRRGAELGDRRLGQQADDRLQDDAVGDEAGLEFANAGVGFFFHGRAGFGRRRP